jgi:hypothetical protein
MSLSDKTDLEYKIPEELTLESHYASSWTETKVVHYHDIPLVPSKLLTLPSKTSTPHAKTETQKQKPRISSESRLANFTNESCMVTAGTKQK